mgnify:FL=1
MLEFDIIYKNVITAIDPTKLLILGLIAILVIVILYQAIKNSNRPVILKIKTLFLGLVEGIMSILKMKKKCA